MLRILSRNLGALKTHDFTLIERWNFVFIQTEGVVEFVSNEEGCDDSIGDSGERGNGDPHHAGDREEHGEGDVTEREQDGEQDTWENIGDNDVITDTESLFIT